MKLHYIFHSGFAIETDDTVVIIDYFQDSSDQKINTGIVNDKLLQSGKKIYVLSTHAHPDHFNPFILEWRNKNPKIQYVFSKDILDHRLCKKTDAEFIDKGDSYEDDTLSIEAFGSTDQGISMLIHINKSLIFHAGDLNNWHWKSDASEEESLEAEQFYLAELTEIYRKYKVMDLVIFPVDPRMQKDYYLGAEQFIEKISTKYFTPMHFDYEYKEASAFKAIAQKNGAKFLEIKEKGQTFELDL
ncbi:MBL fold metallo-hydrolase [Bacteroides coprosuis]|uniref:MBL fold metallo-hydrolase n=1 Tax=Bacteroides coprosuis TaxID=151276 RepID=UPI001D2E86AD|nr:MBL fold metallo-hydrolase [Bacteroides coprosuis]HJD93091.1 MBL fold metallo-hydrolase [Bacteroides coprosuis]